MARRRRREDEGLIALALTSNWQFSAIVAGGCAFDAVVVIPAVFGHNPFLLLLIRFAGSSRSTVAPVLRIEPGSRPQSQGTADPSPAPG